MITMYVIASAIQSKGAEGIANSSHHNPVLVPVPLKYSAEGGIIINIFIK